MPIRISGMYSGLDTESIINELASAQSMKKNSLVKAQTKLSWKQDAWKALNTKIYNFYTNVVDGLRFESSFKKKATKVSDTSAVSVVASNSAVNGTQSVRVNQLAKTGYLTGGDLTTADGVCFTGQATMKQLGFTGTGSIQVMGGLGQRVNIDISEEMTIDDVVGKLQEVGLNASFDQKNQRIFLSSQDTGANANFSLFGNDVNGMNALSALGLLSVNDLEKPEYQTWADYIGSDGSHTAAYDKVIADEVAKRAEEYQKQNESLVKENEEIEKLNQTIRERIAERQTKLEGLAGYDAAETADTLYDKIYGNEVEVPELDEDGNQVLDDEGNPVTQKERQGGLKAELEAAQKELEALEKDETATQEQKEAAQAKVDAAQKAYDEASARYDVLKDIDTDQKAVIHNSNLIQENETTIATNESYFAVDADGKVSGTQALTEKVTDEFDQKVAVAKDIINNAEEYKKKASAVKVDGVDAEITLNGAKFTSASNTFAVNGLTLTALEVTTKDVTITTTEDTDGIFDMVKNFFTEYNKLINEMDTLYNAERAKGYEPLLSEEKDALSDSEVEEWEKKIKDSLLRRDSTLGDVASAMKTVMMQGVSVGGKTMYLSDFGINTLGYFNAKENERNAYHIDGDKDDATVATNENVLKSMIASNPDTVMEFFTKLANNLHDELYDKMASTTASSAFTVYNDKTMKDEYDSYTDKIKTQEDKLNDMIDKWYSKFSAMETALSKLESKNNAVASMFGN